jgi:hypothetical protein
MAIPTPPRRPQLYSSDAAGLACGQAAGSSGDGREQRGIEWQVEGAGMTEDEAKTKTCHMTIAATVIAGEANFYPAVCIGSDCMAWRWEQRFIPREQNAPEITYSKRDGYCGLAGKP